MLNPPQQVDRQRARRVGRPPSAVDRAEESLFLSSRLPAWPPLPARVKTAMGVATLPFTLSSATTATSETFAWLEMLSSMSQLPGRTRKMSTPGRPPHLPLRPAIPAGASVENPDPIAVCQRARPTTHAWLADLAFDARQDRPAGLRLPVCVHAALSPLHPSKNRLSHLLSYFLCAGHLTRRHSFINFHKAIHASNFCCTRRRSSQIALAVSALIAALANPATAQTVAPPVAAPVANANAAQAVTTPADASGDATVTNRLLDLSVK